MPNLALTGDKNTSRPSCRHQKAARFLPRRVPVPPFPGRNVLCPKIAAGPHSHYGITAINRRTRTVSHYDTDEKDRILTIGKYIDGY